MATAAHVVGLRVCGFLIQPDIERERKKELRGHLSNDLSMDMSSAQVQRGESEKEATQLGDSERNQAVSHPPAIGGKGKVVNSCNSVVAD